VKEQGISLAEAIKWASIGGGLPLDIIGFIEFWRMAIM